MLGIITDTLKSATNGLAKILGVGTTVSAGENIYQHAKKIGVIDDENGPWEYEPQSWYKVYPYAFVVEADGKPAFTYTLPIPPQSLVTKMIPASSVTPTVGGAVERTSDTMFWSIQMAGTTGTAVSRSNIEGDKLGANRTEMAKTFRKKLETTGLLSGVSANLNAVIAKAGNIADSVNDVITSAKSGSFPGVADAVVGAINNTILPPLPYSGSSVSDVTNGFTEMQELSRFLYTYSGLKGKFAKRFALKFRNYKTGQEWRVILVGFDMVQTAQQSQLYRYNIQLQGWGVKNIDSDERKDFDRFGPEGDLKSVNTVTPDTAFKAWNGLKSNFSKKFTGSPI